MPYKYMAIFWIKTLYDFFYLGVGGVGLVTAKD
jgi:hypothetical protein